MGEIRVVVDTNVWISAIIRPAGAPGQVAMAVFDGRLSSITCELLLAELMDVAHRPRIRQRWGVAPSAVATILQSVRTLSFIVETPERVEMSRDPDDDIVLATALSGGANYVVTRDDDLKWDLDLVARLEEQGVQAVSVARFLKILDEVG